MGLLLLFSLVSRGQQVEVKGNVDLSDDDSDMIYNVLALRADSSIYKGNVFLNNEFSLAVDLDSLLCIRLSGLGYQPVDFDRQRLKDLVNANVVDIGVVRLTSNLSLGEVTVSVIKKRVSISPTGYSVDLKDSYLSKYGRFDDVIRRIPGITVAPHGDIEVIGKSNPLFVLNGRRLTSSADLKRLDPKNIKTIHVDQEPGPEYDAVYDAVVRVETIDRNQEFYSVDVTSHFEYARKPTGYVEAVVDAKSGNFSYSVDMQYDHTGYKQYDMEEKSVWNDLDTISTNRSTTLQGKINSGAFAPVIQWAINERNKLEAIYHLDHSMDRSTSTQGYSADISGKNESADTYWSTRDKRTCHNPSLYYTYLGDIHTLRVSADYYRMNTEEIQDVNEVYDKGLTNINNRQNFNDKYEIYGGAADYSATVKGWKISGGGKISGIRDDGRYLTNDDSESFSQLKDDTYALYAGLAKSFSVFSLSTALRAEWNPVDYRSSTFEEPVKSDHFNLFPSFTARYNGKGLAATLSYARRIVRPSFSDLNPNRSYIDPLSYMTGNPLLRSMIRDQVTFRFQASNLIFIAVYAHDKNPLVGVLELTNDNKIAYTKQNMPNMQMLDFAGIYSFDRAWFHSNLLLQARLHDIHYQGIEYSKFSDKPTFIARLNLDFDLWKGGTFNVTGYCQNNYKQDVTRMRNSGYVSVELGQDFLKDKLRLTVGGMDLFKSFKPNTWSTYLPNSTIRMATDADSRYVYVTVQFKFGKMKPVQSSGSIISDEKNRL